MYNNRPFCNTCATGRAIRGIPSSAIRYHETDYASLLLITFGVKLRHFEEQIGWFLSAMKLYDNWKTKVVRQLDIVSSGQSEKQRLRLELQINRVKSCSCRAPSQRLNIASNAHNCALD